VCVARACDPGGPMSRCRFRRSSWRWPLPPSRRARAVVDPAGAAAAV
jgi:hypothetical protein